MILRVVDQARKVQGFDDLCVATDDERIAEVCRDENVDVVLTRSDHPSGTDRLSEVARIKGWGSDDIIVNIQGDEPLLPAQLVQQVAQLLIDQPQCSMSTLCEPIHELDEFQRDSIVKVVKAFMERLCILVEPLFLMIVMLPGRLYRSYIRRLFVIWGFMHIV